MYLDTITRSVGLVLITAAVLRLLNVIEFSSLTQLGFTLSALFLTVADFDEFRFTFKKRRGVTNQPSGSSPKRELRRKVNFWHYLSIFSLFILPNLRLPVSFMDSWLEKVFNWYIVNINDSATLVALGLVILLVAYKRTHNELETKKTKKAIEEIQKEIEELKQKQK